MLNVEIKSNAKGFWSRGVFLLGTLVAIDQFLKASAEQIFKNYNFAFSLPLNVYLMYSIYLAVVSVMLIYLVNNFKHLVWAEIIFWIFILAGVLSNFFERMILGYVRDWIYISNGVFNLADIYIIFGILMLLFNHKKLDSVSKQ